MSRWTTKNTRRLKLSGGRFIWTSVERLRPTLVFVRFLVLFVADHRRRAAAEMSKTVQRIRVIRRASLLRPIPGSIASKPEVRPLAESANVSLIGDSTLGCQNRR